MLWGAKDSLAGWTGSSVALPKVAADDIPVLPEGVFRPFPNRMPRRFPKGERKALWCARMRSPFFCWGLDAPPPARAVGLPPRGGQYFLSKRKKVPKKASGTATTGKRLLLPILPAGLAMSRAMKLDSFHQLLERARARLFPPSKWAGLFPSAAYRRSVPPQLAWGRLKRRCLGCFGVVSVVLRHRKTDLNR